jgi:hypothetical protein
LSGLAKQLEYPDQIIVLPMQVPNHDHLLARLKKVRLECQHLTGHLQEPDNISFGQPALLVKMVPQQLPVRPPLLEQQCRGERPVRGRVHLLDHPVLAGVRQQLHSRENI